MSLVLNAGILVLAGYILGELAEKVKLPKIAAFDDVMGIIIFTLVSAIAAVFLGQDSTDYSALLETIVIDIGGAVIIGIILGYLFKFLVKFFKKQSEGSLIVITLAMILLSYGISEYFKFEALLSSMVLGFMVINYNPISDKILNLVERYTEELIFVIFFSLSGLHLQLSSIGDSLLIIIFYIIARMAGKFFGIYTGAKILNADSKIKKFTSGGLIPQGGIVIGLALLLTKKPGFEDHASMIIGIVIGAALIHEIIGPVISRFSLKKAGEI